MMDHELAYLAGIVDAEGSISSVGQGNVQLALATTSEPLCCWLEERLGGHLRYRQKPSVLSRRPVWVWRMTGSLALEWLRRIQPYLIVKREQADLALQLTGLLGEKHHGYRIDGVVKIRRLEILEAIAAANHR